MQIRARRTVLAYRPVLVSMTGAVLAAAGLIASVPAVADAFTSGEHGFLYTGGSFTQIDVPGASSTAAAGINGEGQIVGSFTDGTGTHGFLDTDGNFTQIDVPGAGLTSAYGINNAGQIVGGALGSSTGDHGFLYTDGKFTQIDPGTNPSAGFTSANSINGAGQIVGSFENHGFLYTGGIYTQIQAPGASLTSAQGINDAGQIVGWFNNNTGSHGFLDTDGNFTQIDVPVTSPTAVLTVVNAINNIGQVVGSVGTGQHGFIGTGGNFTQIDVPGSSSTVANGINDAGQIVGTTFVGSVVGDPHFTTYGGVRYDYQGIGDFLLTRSLVLGDQFDVQIRTTGFSNAGTAVITEAAATLCDHNVTFDINRASAGGSFVWIDGSPTLLNHDDPILTLGACKIVELSNNAYEVDWNTGEILDVIDNGTYLDLSSSFSWIDWLGTMEGLLTSNINPDAWRVTEGSLFDPDPVPEPTTLSLIGIGIGLTAIAMMRRRRVPKGSISVFSYPHSNLTQGANCVYM